MARPTEILLVSGECDTHRARGRLRQRPHVHPPSTGRARSPSARDPDIEQPPTERIDLKRRAVRPVHRSTRHIPTVENDLVEVPLIRIWSPGIGSCPVRILNLDDAPEPPSTGRLVTSVIG